MNKAYKYRIYPTTEQQNLLEKTFGCCRFVYNQMLSVQQRRYENNEKFLPKLKAFSYMTNTIKPLYPFLKEVDSQALMNSVFALDKAFQSFFAKKSGYPKFKSKHHSKRSYTSCSVNGNIKIFQKHIKLPKLGKVKAKIHRSAPVDWKLKAVTVSEDSTGCFYASILYEYEEASVAMPAKEYAIGLDYKSNGLFADSNGNTCDMPHYYKVSEKKLAKAQRKLKNKTIGSNNYRKQQKLVAKIHKHSSNQRKDFLHKKSTEIANQYDFVCVENLNIRNMANASFGNGKATLDNGYGMFLNMLEYKLTDRGGKLIKVDKWFPSSQICHQCRTVHPEMKNLATRTFRCGCGIEMDRDHNAAINIKAEGLKAISI